MQALCKEFPVPIWDAEGKRGLEAIMARNNDERRVQDQQRPPGLEAIIAEMNFSGIQADRRVSRDTPNTTIKQEEADLPSDTQHRSFPLLGVTIHSDEPGKSFQCTGLSLIFYPDSKMYTVRNTQQKARESNGVELTSFHMNAIDTVDISLFDLYDMVEAMVFLYSSTQLELTFENPLARRFFLNTLDSNVHIIS